MKMRTFLYTSIFPAQVLQKVSDNTRCFSNVFTKGSYKKGTFFRIKDGLDCLENRTK